MIDELKIGIYEFLLKCKPVYEEDADIDANGRTKDCSKYILSPVRVEYMETLAYDLGVTIRETEGVWEAIQRYMENEINAEKKETSDKS